MVQAIGLLIPMAGQLTVAGVALTTAAGGLTLAGSLVNFAGLTLLNKALAQMNEPKPDDVQINSKAAVAARMRHYGLVKAGGNTVFHRARDGVSYRVIVHGHGEISGVVQRYLNTEPVELDAEGYVTHEQYYYKRPRVRLVQRLGLVPHANPLARISAIWPEWGADHRLDGLWHSLIICEAVKAEKFRAMYPKNEPDLTVLAQTSKCLDPRTGAVAFTENMALAIADYVASPDGFNRPGAFDAGDIAVQADLCDQDVALATGGTEKLYRISGSYMLNEKPQAVLGRMLEACAGRVRLKPSGKVALKVGVWTEPEFTLGFADLLEVQDVTSGPDLLDRYNLLPARFNSHALGHVEVDAEPWQDAARLAEDGEVLVGPDRSLLMSPSHRQTRAVMKIHMERDNPRQEIRLLCKPRALPAIYEDVIALDIAQMGLVGAYEVGQYSLSFEKGLLRAVGLSLRLVDPAAFTLGLSEQGAVQSLPEPDTASGVPVPQNVVAAAAGIKTAENSFVAAIGVAWQEPPSDALEPVLKIAQAGSETWQDVTVGAGVSSVTVPGLIQGMAYDIALAFKTPGGVVGEAVEVLGVVALADSTPPAPPTGLAVIDTGTGSARVEMLASSSASLWKTEIYRDGVLVGLVYAGPGSAIAFVDSCGAGSFAWTARSVNVADIASSSDAGPVSASIA